MEKLTEMIIEAIDRKQRELDQEFYSTLDKSNNIEFTTHPIDGIGSEQERVTNKLHELYTLLDKCISEEKFELATDIRETIKAIKTNFKI